MIEKQARYVQRDLCLRCMKISDTLMRIMRLNAILIDMESFVSSKHVLLSVLMENAQITSVNAIMDGQELVAMFLHV